MFHKEGKTIILATLILALIGTDLTYFLLEDLPWLQYIIYAVLAFFVVIVLQFFRNPKRNTNVSENHVVAPVDGKVVVIEEVYEPEYFKDKRLQVSIFMSPLNVHVTRYGLSGLVKYSKYHPGKYLVAWHPKASEENERTSIVIENTTFGEVLYRQIAGALAKRIVNYAVEGTEVLQGTDAGFIKFGSRVDLFLPLNSKINVSLNQTVKGAEDVIASL